MKVLPNTETLSAYLQHDGHRTATTPATAMTAAARLPTPWLEAPPVDSAAEGPVADADPAEPAADAMPVLEATNVEVIPELVTAAVVVMTAVFVQEQEESYDSVV